MERFNSDLFFLSRSSAARSNCSDSSEHKALYLSDYRPISTGIRFRAPFRAILIRSWGWMVGWYGKFFFLLLLLACINIIIFLLFLSFVLNFETQASFFAVLSLFLFHGELHCCWKYEEEWAWNIVWTHLIGSLVCKVKFGLFCDV